jgi:hypothetical protein
MKRLLTLLIMCGMVLSLAACAAQATPVYAEGAEKDAAAAAAEPFAQNIIYAIHTNDYALFSSNFSPTMKSAMGQTEFDKIMVMFADYGTYQSRELVNVQIVEGYYRINYTVTYENKIVLMGVVIPSTGTPDVQGLWFN